MSDLLQRLGGLPRPDAESAHPRLFHVAREDDAGALERLIASGEVAWVHDTLAAQLAELIATRRADRAFAPEELERAVAEHVAGVPPERYGTWVYYPWSRRLVHVLPKEEFRELRSSRNRNKITAAEQERLGALKVGVAGLSVGQATAVTLALEGVGGQLRLADFDALSLSNMNRLRAGVDQIGVNKAVLTARAIAEIDPYLEVLLFTDGVHEGNLDAFLMGAGWLDLLFEECDDLAMKLRLRERAREFGIPVLMETSDRGLIDVERFDREPARPLLHGLVGDLDAASLAGKTTYEKVPVVLDIIGGDTMSPRLAASLVDIDATLKTWPQLASAVALGGAVNTDVARRVALGQMSGSGRFFVDLAQLVCDGASVTVGRHAEEPAPPEEPPPLQPLVRTGGAPGPAEVAALVEHGVRAPSGGNCQPWLFVWRGGRLRCVHDERRSRSFLDFEHRASWLAFGAAVENIRLAAAQLGLETHVAPWPDAGEPQAVCDLSFQPARVPVDPLVHQIGPRVTNRRIGARAPLEAGVLEQLADVARAAGAQLTFVTARERLGAAGELLGRADRLRFLSPVMHREMMGEIRWSARQAAATRDGLDLRSLELDPTEAAGLRLLSRAQVASVLGAVRGGQGLEKLARKSVAGASALGLLLVEDLSPVGCLRAGMAFERVWLEATSRGLALQPMTALVYLLQRLEAGGQGLALAEAAELAALDRLYRRIFEPAAGRTALMLFRIGRAAPPSARSLRRSVGDVLVLT